MLIHKSRPFGKPLWVKDSDDTQHVDVIVVSYRYAGVRS